MLRLHVRFPLRLHRFILCTRRSGGTAHEGGGCDQSIGSTVSDAIVRCWLWSTVTRSSPLGYFSTLLQVVDNCPHIRWYQILYWEAPGHRRFYIFFIIILCQFKIKIYEYIFPTLVLLPFQIFFSCPICHATIWAYYKSYQIISRLVTKPSVYCN